MINSCQKVKTVDTLLLIMATFSFSFLLYARPSLSEEGSISSLIKSSQQPHEKYYSLRFIDKETEVQIV